MNTLIRFFNPFAHATPQDALYDVVENQLIQNRSFKSLTLSGSLFSFSTFKNVTFEDCTFFSSKIENCHFINCHFINCSFQFSGVEHSTFCEVEFNSTHWDVSPFRKNRMESCLLDHKTSYFSKKSSSFNHFKGCVDAFGPIEVTTVTVEEELLGCEASALEHQWRDLAERQEVLPPLPCEQEGETKTFIQFKGQSAA